MTGEQYLLLPGPTPVPERILRAMSRPLVNHRGPEFKEILLEVTEAIKKVYRTRQNLLIYPSSGTGVLEAAVVNFISPGDRVLAVSIGVFGDRFATIAERFGAEVEKIAFPWGEAADPEIIADRLGKDKGHSIKAILITHNETSTGVFNDIRAVRKAMGDHPAMMMVDTVSGLAALDFRMDEWGIDVALSGSQKAFMIPPGLGFMAFSDRAYQAYKQNKNSRFYWDIQTGLDYLEKGQNPVTPPISLYYGLQEALRIMEKEGLDNTLKRHRHYRDMVRAAVQEIGLKLLAKDENASCAVTSVLAPEGLGANKIRSFMLEHFNIAIAGGQQSLDDKLFRIGHLGYVRELDLLAVIAALEITLKQFDYPLEMGRGVKKAQEYLFPMSS